MLIDLCVSDRTMQETRGRPCLIYFSRCNMVTFVHKSSNYYVYVTIAGKHDI